MKQVYRDIHQIQVPLPGNPLKILNAYLILGEERNLLIDTGFNHEKSLSALREAFQMVGAEWKKTDLLITHLHVDHSGLAYVLADKDRKIYMSRKDGLLVNNLDKGSYWDGMEEVFCKHGMPKRVDDQDPTPHPGELFQSIKPFEVSWLADGDDLTIGDFHFTVFITPGHSPEHICLYETEKKILISGDQVLDKITPIITLEVGLEDPLTNYLQSLKRLALLDVDLCLPAHRGIITDFGGRIQELMSHHRDRLLEVLKILQKEKRPMNSYEVASRMTWDMKENVWNNVGRQQRWFATGEAMAHLIYLDGNGQIRKYEDETGIKYIAKDGDINENCNINETII